MTKLISDGFKDLWLVTKPPFGGQAFPILIDTQQARIGGGTPNIVKISISLTALLQVPLTAIEEVSSPLPPAEMELNTRDVIVARDQLGSGSLESHYV